MSHMERATHRGWGSVNGVHPIAITGAIEVVDAVALPRIDPLLLDAVDRGLLRESTAHGCTS